jgi:RluA family pseudouridine synthase
LTTPFQPVVILENDDVIVINKPADFASIPERDEKNDLQHLLSKHAGKRVFAVYSLDKAVTGLMIYAKTAEAHKFISEQFNSGKLQKIYIALVHGSTKEKKGSITAAIRKFGSGRMGVDTVRGVGALTKWEILERFPQHTLLRVYPETARRHQIRVHLFSIGHPIVGDPLYGDPKIQQPFPQILLHAHEIRFESAPGQEHHLTATLSPAFMEAKKVIPQQRRSLE